MSVNTLRAGSLHSSGWAGVFYITGGGSLLISELLTTPGASGSVKEIQVPYAHSALTDLIKQAPEQACSASTGRALAMTAFQRARALGSDKPFGLGCTAGLATNREKKGAHRAHITVQTSERTNSVEVQFNSDRETEEQALLQQLWALLNDSLSLQISTEQDVAAISDSINTLAPPSWQALITEQSASALINATDTGKNNQLLLPGSFNPIHDGHLRMLAIAEQQTGLTGAFELSIGNVDKPYLDYTEISDRLAHIQQPIWLTRLPTFVEKAREFPHSKFAVGADTIKRIAMPKYYESTRHRNQALKELAILNTRFIVFGRVDKQKFVGLDDLRLPKALRELCDGVSESDFRADVSSTELRRNARRQ